MTRFQPISFMFIAAGVGIRARMALAKFTPSYANGQYPQWNGRDGEPQTHNLATPITDIEHWDGRYVLTELTFKKADGQTLTMNDAVVSVSMTKNVVKTALVGLSGTIKEYINNGDYDISINVGIVAVDPSGNIIDEYPEEGIRTVKKFMDENQSIEVQSVFMDIFPISRMVVEKFALTQQTASNRQEIEIRAVSDEDYVIKSTEY